MSDVTKIYIESLGPIKFSQGTVPDSLTGKVEIYLPAVSVRIIDDIDEDSGLSIVKRHHALLASFDLGKVEVSSASLVNGIKNASDMINELSSIAILAISGTDGKELYKMDISGFLEKEKEKVSND